MKNSIASHKKPILLNIAKLFESYNVENKHIYYTELFKTLHDVIKFSNASIFFFNSDTNKLELVFTYGDAVDLIKTVEFEFGKGLSAWLAKEQKHIILNNIGKNTDENSIQSFLSIPLILENKLYGLINFGHHRANIFTKKCLPYLKVVAPFIAAMLSQNRYIETLQEQKEEIALINKTLKQTQDKLLELQKKEVVSATVCSLNHEINNPLMIISGNVQLLQSSEIDENTREKLHSIEEQIERITEIVSKLRELDSPQFEKYIKDGSYDKILKLNSSTNKIKE